MKRTLSVLLGVILALSLFPVYTVALAADDPFAFDPDTALLGDYTLEATADEPAVTIRVYQVVYVSKPLLNEFEGASNIHKMNIKVPVSIDGTAVSEDATDAAPILFYNPWGGDNGRPVGLPDATNAMTRRALSEGWVVAEPGMRGKNHTTLPGQGAYYNYGKLPEPIVDLKAALRYLHYNADVMFGDTEKIIAAGTSSGGSAASILGASGNTAEYDSYLAKLGAAPARDDVFAAAPSCPIITRDMSDSAAVWMRWGTSLPEGSHETNIELAQWYQDYQEGLGLPITDFASYEAYALPYLKASLIKFLNALGGKAMIDEYLTTMKPPSMFNALEAPRDWIKPVYDANGVVTDVNMTYRDYITYASVTTKNTPVNRVGPATDNAWAYDEYLLALGVTNQTATPGASATTNSMGFPEQVGAVFSDFGWMYIKREFGRDVWDGYKDLITMQRNSVDPMHFLLGEEVVDVAPNWFIRNGADDTACILPFLFNMSSALEQKGLNVDLGVTWDQGHGLTNDIDGFVEWAKEIIA